MTVLQIGLTLVFGLSILVGGASAEPPEDKPSARTDRYGDPLPEGAIARLGTVRFRHAGALHAMAFSPDGKILVASSDDKNMLVIWDRTNGRKVREIPLADKGSPPKLPSQETRSPQAFQRHTPGIATLTYTSPGACARKV